MMDVNACVGIFILFASSKSLSRLFCLYSKVFACIVTSVICAEFWSVPFCGKLNFLCVFQKCNNIEQVMCFEISYENSNFDGLDNSKLISKRPWYLIVFIIYPTPSHHLQHFTQNSLLGYQLMTCTVQGNISTPCLHISEPLVWMIMLQSATTFKRNISHFMLYNCRLIWLQLCRQYVMKQEVRDIDTAKRFGDIKHLSHTSCTGCGLQRFS